VAHRSVFCSFPYALLRPSCSGGQADVLAMLARIVGAVSPSDLALLHSALGCHLVTALGYDPAALSASVAQGACAAAVTGGGGP
jgi:hypothetical protein